jgi:hypothetical protein
VGAVGGGGTEGDTLGAAALAVADAETATAALAGLAGSIADAFGEAGGGANGVAEVVGVGEAAAGADGRGPSIATLSATIAQAPIAIVPIASLRRRRSPASASA